MPHIYAGVDYAAPLRFNPLYSVYGDVIVPSEAPRWQALTNGKGIGIPVKTSLHPTVEVGFLSNGASVPSANNTVNWLLASSNNETAPSIGIAKTNGYTRIVMRYPNDKIFTPTNSLLSNGIISFKDLLHWLSQTSTQAQRKNAKATLSQSQMRQMTCCWWVVSPLTSTQCMWHMMKESQSHCLASMQAHTRALMQSM